MATQGDSGVELARVDGVELAYEVFGEKDRPAILLIMGLGSQMVIWDEEFCRGLAELGFRVIRFDNRDIGLSTKLSQHGWPDFERLMQLGPQQRQQEAPYTLDHMAGDAVGLMDSLGVDSAHLAGISMGGMIAQQIALHHPERVKSLTSISSSTGNPKLPQSTPEAQQILYNPLPTEWSEFIQSFRHMWRVFAGPHYPLEDDLLEKWGRLSYERGLSPDGTARQMAAILASGNRKKALSGVRVPTLVVHGDADPLLPPECGRDTAEAIPGS